jgi:2-(1,2-epoxy-1,2-dihydrophenyl)acetyl-CoA isomerase
MTETILLSIHDHIATITFNRPNAMNSFNRQMADELPMILRQVRDDTAVRAVVLNGSGNAFMAGGDIRFFHAALDQMPEVVPEMIGALHQSITDLMTMPKPVLASVHGSVAGAGMSLMLACDLVVADTATKFTTAYSSIGLSPDGGATFNLPRLVGTKNAMEWLLLSDLFDADTAKNVGIVNWVVPSETLTSFTDNMAARLAIGPTQSYSRIKHLVNTTWQHDLATQLQQESVAFQASTLTKDFREGVTNFIQKQPPIFVGE